VRGTNFPWLKRYPQLIELNPLVEKEGVTGYDIALNSFGVPYRLIPRAASEFKIKSRFQLLSVNESECRKNPCRRLVVKHGDRWALAQNGNNLLELLTY
jgi:hypothetical protein